MTALIGFLVLHVLGAAVLAIVDRRPFTDALQRPVSVFVGLAILFCAALGPSGIPLAVVLVLGAWLSPRKQERLAPPLQGGWFVVVGVVTVVVLARPWVPLYWDEFVWLAKARLGASGLGEVVAASLDPARQLIPAGYVPLWPAAVGWLSLGDDALDTHTLAASLLMLACFAVALEAWWSTWSTSRLTVLVALAAPLAWVHLRSTYVDLPVGFLSLALLGRLLHGRAGLGALALAVALAGFKDEGVAHVLAATVAALLVRPPAVTWWRLLGPLGAAVVVSATWRLLLSSHGVAAHDHALHPPEWGWLWSLGRLLLLHASDVLSWGVTWAVAVAVAARRNSSSESRALRWLLVGNFVSLTAALLLGPERVRVFADSGSLLNRALLQSWPAAATLIIAALPPTRPAVTDRAA